MVSREISLDNLLEDIEQQLEILTAIAADNAILLEQLRLLQEAKELLVSQDMEISRLVEMLDPDQDADFSTLSERGASEEDTIG